MTEPDGPPLKILRTITTGISVTFMTNKGVTEAWEAEEGGYNLRMQPLEGWFAWFLAHEHWFPQILRVVAREYGEYSLPVPIAMVLLVICMIAQFTRLTIFLVSPPTQDAGLSSHFAAIAVAVTAVMLVLWFVRNRLSPWTRVAVLVRETYDTTGALEIDPARYESQSGRYNPWRFTLPYMALFVAVRVVRLNERLGIPPWSLPFLIWELLLWIDVWIGWDRVPVVKQFAALVQRALYPIPPNEGQVQAGQQALAELVRRVRTGTLSS